MTYEACTSKRVLYVISWPNGAHECVAFPTMLEATMEAIDLCRLNGLPFDFEIEPISKEATE